MSTGSSEFGYAGSMGSNQIPLGDTMNRVRKSPQKAREAAYIQQDSRCYYCSQPMWLGNPASFIRRFKLKESQIRKLQCTAEHLHPWKDGGSNGRQNIVAACLYCNQLRHRRRKEIDPLTYKKHVQKRLSARRWHGLVLTELQAVPEEGSGGHSMQV